MNYIWCVYLFDIFISSLLKFHWKCSKIESPCKWIYLVWYKYRYCNSMISSAIYGSGRTYTSEFLRLQEFFKDLCLLACAQLQYTPGNSVCENLRGSLSNPSRFWLAKSQAVFYSSHRSEQNIRNNPIK